jgi:hypothetical protein
VRQRELMLNRQWQFRVSSTLGARIGRTEVIVFG